MPGKEGQGDTGDSRTTQTVGVNKGVWVSARLTSNPSNALQRVWVSAHLSSKLHLEYTYGQTTTTFTMSFKKDEESGGLCTSPFYAVDSADI